MFSVCLRGFSSGTVGASSSPETVGVNECERLFVFLCYFAKEAVIEKKMNGWFISINEAIQPRKVAEIGILNFTRSSGKSRIKHVFFSVD